AERNRDDGANALLLQDPERGLAHEYLAGRDVANDHRRPVLHRGGTCRSALGLDQTEEFDELRAEAPLRDDPQGVRQRIEQLQIPLCRSCNVDGCIQQLVETTFERRIVPETFPGDGSQYLGGTEVRGNVFFGLTLLRYVDNGGDPALDATRRVPVRRVDDV